MPRFCFRLQTLYVDSANHVDFESIQCLTTRPSSSQYNSRLKALRLRVYETQQSRQNLAAEAHQTSKDSSVYHGPSHAPTRSSNFATLQLQDHSQNAEALGITLHDDTFTSPKNHPQQLYLPVDGTAWTTDDFAIKFYDGSNLSVSPADTSASSELSSAQSHQYFSSVASSYSNDDMQSIECQGAFERSSYIAPEWVTSLFAPEDLVGMEAKTLGEVCSIADYFCAARSYADAFDLYHLAFRHWELQVTSTFAPQVPFSHTFELLSSLFNCARTATTPSQRAEVTDNLASILHRSSTTYFCRPSLPYLLHLYLSDMNDVLGETDSASHAREAMEDRVYRTADVHSRIVDGRNCRRHSIASNALPDVLEVSASEEAYPNCYHDILVVKHLLEYKGGFKHRTGEGTGSILGRVSGYTLHDFEETVAKTPFWDWCSRAILSRSKALDRFITVVPADDSAEKDFITTILFCYLMEVWLLEKTEASESSRDEGTVLSLINVLTLSNVNAKRFSLPDALAAASFILVNAFEKRLRGPDRFLFRARTLMSAKISRALLLSISTVRERQPEFGYHFTVCERPQPLQDISRKALMLFARRLVSSEILSGGSAIRVKQGKSAGLAPNVMDFKEYKIRRASFSGTLLPSQSSTSLSSSMSISTGRSRPSSSGGSVWSRRSSWSFTVVTGMPHAPPALPGVNERTDEAAPVGGDVMIADTRLGHGTGASNDMEDDFMNDAVIDHDVGIIYEEAEDQDMQDMQDVEEGSIGRAI